MPSEQCHTALLDNQWKLIVTEPPSCEIGGEKEPCHNEELATDTCEEFKVQIGVFINKEEVLDFRILWKDYTVCWYLVGEHSERVAGITEWLWEYFKVRRTKDGLNIA